MSRSTPRLVNSSSFELGCSQRLHPFFCRTFFISLHMRFAVLFYSAFFCFAFNWTAVAQSPADSGPDIRFESRRIDYGDVLYQKDSTYVYHFVYENTGTDPLIINKVIGHCPCVTVSHSTEPLPPGGRDSLSVYFKPSHASKYSQPITVFNNSSSRSVVTLYARGNFLNPSAMKKEE